MENEERIARDLCGRLRAFDLEVSLEGGGVHWRVELAGRTRQCVIHCFWYGFGPSDLQLGMNPANQRAIGQPHHVVRTGAEYQVVLSQDGRQVADGRTGDLDKTVACAEAWIKRESSIDEVERKLPFVDAPRRKMRELVAQIEARVGDTVRCKIEYELLHELWAYGDGRSCRLDPTDGDRVVSSLWIGGAQVAHGDVTADPGGLVENWLVQGLPLDEIASHFPLSVERHANLLEVGDAARWHWLHVADRLGDPDDVLLLSRSLIERLMERPAVTAFFSYTSLHSLCFTASSHFPWADDNLPGVWPPGEDPHYVVEIGSSRTTCSADHAADLIEATLEAHPIRPFFGCASILAVAPLDAELAAQGSSLQAEIWQRQQWFDARVTAGDRSCTVLHHNLRALSFEERGSRQKTAEYPDTSSAVTALRRWLEEHCTPDQI